ncbi:Alpha crystallin/Hsp20 domain and HSP20-like chaperone domain-containing protein [Aphelenchoides besseyi]|nr:Alpha crystallin/Hsp20 domain and HSP20-like chaperone domain-containing protein [Aphelenchoides besseyi]KAI6200315.1 Alpha crystallin/Hsp20 domain and HSP20-like chaperone domain-containing protein [Aphelenchoides besseyi]
MAPNIKPSSPWNIIREWNSPIAHLRNQQKQNELNLCSVIEQSEFPPTIKRANSKSSKTELRPFQPRADCDPIDRIDQELAKLREAPSKVINERRRYIVRVELGTFRPESITVIVETDKLVVRCEEIVDVNEWTSVMKRFVRRINLPMKELQTEMMATEMNTLGTLTITMLKR